MSAPAHHAFAQTLRWMTSHTRFPASRLPDKAELLVLIATAAAEEEQELQSRQKAAPGVPYNATYNAQIRNYTIKRRHAHKTCDNSAKV